MEAKHDFKQYNVADFKDDCRLTFKVMNKVLPRRTSRISWLTFKDDFKDDFGIGLGRTSPHQDLHHANDDGLGGRHDVDHHSYRGDHDNGHDHKDEDRSGRSHNGRRDNGHHGFIVDHCYVLAARHRYPHITDQSTVPKPGTFRGENSIVP